MVVVVTMLVFVMLHALFMVLDGRFMVLYVLFMTLDAGLMVFDRRFTMGGPFRMMLRNPVTVVGTPPCAVMPLVVFVPIAVPAPLGMILDPFGMVLINPVRIVLPPPTGLAPHVVGIVGTHRLNLSVSIGMPLQPHGKFGMVAQIGRIVHQTRIRP